MASSKGPGTGSKPITISSRSGRGISPSVAISLMARIDRERSSTAFRMCHPSVGGAAEHKSRNPCKLAFSRARDPLLIQR
jgi:hypothetical protein